MLLGDLEHPGLNRLEGVALCGHSETVVLESLQALEGRRLVRARTDRIESPKPQPGTGVPEYEVGRTRLLWWELTPAGRAAAEGVASRLTGRTG